MSERFTVYPAIDLIEGRVVRLTQGDRARRTLYPDPAEGVAARLREAGADWLHVVDLDAAFDRPTPENDEAVSRLLELDGLRIQLGGGLRGLDEIEAALEAGVQRAVVGTVALERPKVLREALERFGRDRLAVAVDAQEGRIKVHGWTVESDLTVQDYTDRLAEDGVETLIYTDTTRDGTGAGLAIEVAAAIQRRTGIDTIVSGGAATLADVRRARQVGLAGTVVGKALHDGRLTPEEVLAC